MANLPASQAVHGGRAIWPTALAPPPAYLPATQAALLQVDCAVSSWY